MTDNPELRAKILDWQRRYNIQDGDPAIALLELVQFMAPSAQSAPAVIAESRPLRRARSASRRRFPASR